MSNLCCSGSRSWSERAPCAHSVHTHKRPCLPWSTLDPEVPRQALHCLSSRSPWEKNKHVCYIFDLEVITGIARRLWWKCVWLKKERKCHSHACAKCYLGRACSAPARVRAGPLLTWPFSFLFPSLTYITVQNFRIKKLLPSDVQQVWVKHMCCKTGLWGSTVWASTSWQLAESPGAQLSWHIVLSLYCH